MANKIRSMRFINDGSPVSVTYDVLDLNGNPTSLGKTILVPLTATQVTSFVSAVTTAVNNQVAADLTAAQAQLANTTAT